MFRKQVEDAKKIIIMEFCNPDGEMIPARHVDLIAFGEILIKKGLDVTPSLMENLANLFECFG
jgi:hypothetical protein